MPFLPKTLRIVLVEDSLETCDTISRYVAANPDFEIIAYCDKVEQAVLVIQREQPDILVLDIHLLDGTAFDLLQRIDAQRYRIIFITNHSVYALRAIKFGALDYILKPINREEFDAALQKVQTTLPVANEQLNIAYQSLHQTPNKIVIPTQQYLQVVLLSEIIYCHGVSGYTTFYLTDNRTEIACRYLKEYENVFGKEFIRPHQSYIVNGAFIERYYKEGYLKLKNEVIIPVSVRKKDEVKGYFKQTWIK